MTTYDRRALLPFAALVALVWIGLSFHTSSVADPWDTVLLLAIAVVSGLATVYQLIRTRLWTVRGLGVLGYVAGTALAMASGADARLVHHLAPQAVTDLARALWIVGGPLLIYGIIATTVDEQRLARSVERLEVATARNVALSATLARVAGEQDVRQGEQDVRQGEQDVRQGEQDVRQGEQDNERNGQG